MTFKEKINCLKWAFEKAAEFDKSFFPIMLASALFSSFVPLIPTYFTAKIIDELASGRDLKILFTYAAVMVVLTAVCEYLRDYISNIERNKRDTLRFYEGKLFTQSVCEKDFEIIENKDFQDSVKAYDTVFKNNYGSFYNMFFNTTNFLTGMLSLVLSLIMVGPVIKKCFEIDNSSFLTSYKPLLILAAVVVICAVIMILVGNKYTDKVNSAQLKINTQFGKFVYWFDFAKNYKNGKEIRIYDSNALILSKRDKQLENQHDILISANNMIAENQSILMFFQTIIMGAFYLFVAAKAYAGAFSVGSFVMFVGASMQIANGIGLVGSISTVIGLCAQWVYYLKRIVDTDTEMYHGTLPVEKRSDNQYEFEFKNVSFKYPNTDEYVLKNINTKIKIGENLALVGKNGSGKTTFIKLLCRLYDVTDGEITLNGINIKKYDIKEYMSLFSVVFQDFQLFSVALSQNVSTTVDYDRKKLYDCLDKAGIKDKVLKMYDKENSVIYKDIDKKGIDISGGEAQKIAIARAIYKDSPFVILDEPTSALDPVSEFEIYKNFNRFVGGKTAVYISHRLSSCRFCDNIYVFDKGQIVQSGSHDELVAKQEGQYYRLWTSQSKYYI